jgi:hypothetical protein
VVNDGSSDDTREQYRGASSLGCALEAIERTANGGYGAAMKDGLARARANGADVVACVHADGQYAPEVLPRLVSTLRQRELDLLQGSRVLPGTALAGGMPLYKYAANAGLNVLENLTLGLGLSDYHSGYLVCGRRTLERVPFDQLSNSFDFDLEVIASPMRAASRSPKRRFQPTMATRFRTCDPFATGCACSEFYGTTRRASMTPADLTSSWLLRGSVALPLLVLACHAGSAKFPWPASAESRPATHAEVRTLNASYQRTKSEVLVREIDQPTRANLDYAAYHQNFMIATSPPEDAEAPPTEPNTANPFAGSIEKASLSADFEALPLTESERSHPLAFAPLVEFLAAQKVAGADELRELGAKVRDESWGLPRRPGVATQTLTEVFLHSAAGETTPELYVKIEFEPWFTGLGALPDQDHDGYPEVYGRAHRGSINYHYL